MSERTTIGGTVYETIGSSTSNLLLKCNGTARIQWGTKLIDLIKNGKIATEGSQNQIFVIQSDDEIKTNGIYILQQDNSNQLFIYLDGEKYSLTESDLYISTKKQNITAEQKYQALENIGMYYNTLDDVKKANIKSGIVFVLENNTLYTIKEGIINEFEAKIKTITVEQNNSGEGLINNSVKITLSVANDEYFILTDNKILAQKSIHVKNSEQLGSEEANESRGYRLYIDRGISYLDVDKINVRLGLPSQEYIEILHEDLLHAIKYELLEPHRWYLITDFQNHWKLPKHNLNFVRPILVRALTTSTFYKEGLLFKDRRVTIQYDPFYLQDQDQDQYIYQEVPIKSESPDNATLMQLVKAKGRITWMRDNNGNEANFDFLDYTDCNNEPLTTLHKSTEHDSLDKSIFPKYSYNNKLTVYDLYGTVLEETTKVINGQEQVCYVINNENESGQLITNRIDFEFNDDEIPEEGCLKIHDNVIECKGFVLHKNCKEFINNNLTQLCKVEIGSSLKDAEAISLLNNTITLVYNNKKDEKYEKYEKDEISKKITDTLNTIPDLQNKIGEPDLDVDLNLDFSLDFDEITKSTINEYITTQFNTSLENVYIRDFSNSQITSNLNQCQFNKIQNSYIEGVIKECTFNVLNQVIINPTANLEKSTFGYIYLSNINNSITNSTINNIQLSLLDTTIDKCSIKDIHTSKIDEKKLIETDFVSITCSKISAEIATSQFLNTIHNSDIAQSITNSVFNDQIIQSKIHAVIQKSFFEQIQKCTISSKITSVTFMDLNNVTIQEEADLTNATFKTDLEDIILQYVEKDSLINDYLFIPQKLYDASLMKEVFLTTDNKENIKKLQVVVIKVETFPRGTIIMWYGKDIPAGWGLCNGKEQEYEGVKSPTPNLCGHFIQGTNEYVKWEGEDTIQKTVLTKDYLPGLNLKIENSSELVLKSETEFLCAKSGSTSSASSESGESGEGESQTELSQSIVTVNGGVHNHSGSVKYKEPTTETNPVITYFTLQFIMKL